MNKFLRQWTRDATIEELLEAVFSMQSMPRLYSKSRPGNSVSCRHELVATQLPFSENMNTEAEEPPWLAAIT
jgi:hypothetical protein